LASQIARFGERAPWQLLMIGLPARGIEGIGWSGGPMPVRNSSSQRGKLRDPVIKV